MTQTIFVVISLILAVDFVLERILSLFDACSAKQVDFRAQEDFVTGTHNFNTPSGRYIRKSYTTHAFTTCETLG
ncbi:MAG: hypothetical protein ACK5KP_11550 [Paludibacteraceae bacterium]